jgi:hypothetical protein
MRRAVIFLLVACAVLAVGSAAGGLARAAPKTVAERFGAPPPADLPMPSFFVHLPMVLQNASTEPSWVTMVEEGFEGQPGDLWKFYDENQPQQGSYYWGRRGCPPNAGTYSAWAFGGGTLGVDLPCDGGYPGNVDSRMEYGPFSLQDASSADMRFSLWVDRGDAYATDEFCWSAGSSSAELSNNETCLTWDTGTWYRWTQDLGDPNAINMLGKPQVWIAFRFTSYDSGSQAEGVYVDDVVVRKCVGGTCPVSSSSVPIPAASRAEPTPGSRPVKSSSYLSGR